MKSAVRAIAAGLAVLVSAVAHAGTISDPVLSIHATSSLGGGTLNIPYDPADYSPVTHTYNWSLPSETDILAQDGTTVLATISQLSTFIMVDPVVNVGFVLTAGGADTTLSISSATLTFSPIVGAVGQSSAQIGATDTDGNGATITGGFAGNLGYRAHTNVGNFATLVPGFTVGAFGSSNQSGNQPVTAIGTVTSMDSEFNFTVSADDAASGTSVFVVTPEPAALTLLGLAGLFAVRRRS